MIQTGRSDNRQRTKGQTNNEQRTKPKPNKLREWRWLRMSEERTENNIRHQTDNKQLRKWNENHRTQVDRKQRPDKKDSNEQQQKSEENGTTTEKQSTKQDTRSKSARCNEACRLASDLATKGNQISPKQKHRKKWARFNAIGGKWKKLTISWQGSRCHPALKTKEEENKNRTNRIEIVKTEYKHTKIGDDGYRAKGAITKINEAIGKMQWSYPPLRALWLKKISTFHLKKYKSMSSAQKQHGTAKLTIWKHTDQVLILQRKQERKKARPPRKQVTHLETYPPDITECGAVSVVWKGEKGRGDYFSETMKKEWRWIEEQEDVRRWTVWRSWRMKTSNEDEDDHAGLR